MVWVWLCIAPYSTKIHTVTGSPAITGNFWTVTVRESGLSSKYFSQSCEKLTDAIKHSDISGTSELIIHLKWYGIIAQSAALFTSTHDTIHTHYTPALAVSGTS